VHTKYKRKTCKFAGNITPFPKDLVDLVGCTHLKRLPHLCIKLIKVNRGTMLNTNIQGGPFPQFQPWPLEIGFMLGEKEKEKTLKGTQEKKDLQHYPIY